MQVSRRSTQRAAAIKNDPDLAPAVEHVTVADAYRIREEAANSRPGSDRGGVDIIATMPLTAQGRPWGIGRISYFCGADKSSLSDPAVLIQK